MPKPGFTSITFRKHIYEDIEAKYEKIKVQLEKEGIMSISGFFTLMLYTGLEAIEDDLDGRPNYRRKRRESRRA